MPSIQELREQLGAAANDMQERRDAFHAAKEAGKPESELTELREKFAAVKTKFDETRDALQHEKSDAEMDEAIAEARELSKEHQQRRGAKPGLDDADGRDHQPDDRDPTAAPTAEDRSLVVNAWFRRSAHMEIPERHQVALKRCKIRRGMMSRGSIDIDLATGAFKRAYRAAAVKFAPEFLSDAMEAIDERRDDRFQTRELRAMSAQLGSTGGVTVAPLGFASAIEQNMLFHGPMVGLADESTGNTGADFPWPTSDDTSNEGEEVGESQSVDGSTEPTMAAMVLRPHKAHSKMIKLPNELFEDWGASPGPDQFIGGLLGERLGRYRNRRYTTGTGGGSRAVGFMTAATLGITAASATALTGDEILRLQQSIDPTHRGAGGNVGYQMHNDIWTEVMLLKAGDGHYLYKASLDEALRPTIRGQRVWLNNHMDSALATTNKTIAYGNFSKYKSRVVRQIRIIRLGERYAEFDQTAFDAFIRHDGFLLDAGTAPIKYLQQA